MKRHLLTFLLAFGYLVKSQNIKVVDLLGDWYGQTMNSGCTNIMCTFSSISTNLNHGHIRLSIKDSLLVLTDLSSEDPYGFYGKELPLLNDVTFKITHGEIKEGVLNLYQGTLGYTLLDMGGISFVRSKKDYANLLLSTHTWVQMPSKELVQFVVMGDTLVCTKGGDMYLFDEGAQLYRLKGEESRVFEVLNDSLLRLGGFVGDPNGVIYKRARIVPIPVGNTSFSGAYVSTISPKNITYSGQGTINSNLADGLQRIYIADKKNGELSSYLVPQGSSTGCRTYLEFYPESDSVCGAFVYFEFEDASYLQKEEQPSFLINNVVFRFELGEGFVKNKATGEIYSIVDNAENDLVDVGFEDVEYEVFDAQGRLLEKSSTHDGQVPLQGLTDGYYIIKLSAGQRTTSVKVMKKTL